MIYLDYNATAPLRAEVREAMLPFLGAEFGNPSSVHRLGSRARVAVEQARAEVAELVGAQANEVFFTSGGTESNTWGLVGSIAGRDGAIVTSPIEHSSVLEPVAALGRRGHVIHEIGVDREGRVDLRELADRLRHRVALVSIAWANNEIGTVQAMHEIGELCRSAGALLHVDAVQACGKIPVAAGVVDLLSLSAHKVGGPKGMGALVVRRGTKIEPLFRGGGQERGVRSGTENVAGIVGFGVACRLANANLGAYRRVSELRELLWQGLAAANGVVRNSPSAGCLPNTLNVGFSGVNGEALVAALDLEDIAISTGSACAAGAAQASHVLLALGLDEEQARDSVRFSLGWGTTAAEIERAAAVCVAAVKRMRAVRRAEVACA